MDGTWAKTMTAIAEQRLGHLLKGLPRERQAQILAALHNELAHEEKQKVEAEEVRSMMAAVINTDRLAGAARAFLGRLARLVHAPSSSLVLLEPGGHFRVAATRGFHESILPADTPFTNTLTDRLCRRQVPVPLPAVVGRWQRRAGTAKLTGWAVPLLLGGEVRGFATIRRPQADPFTPDHLRLAREAVAAVGPALVMLQRLELMRRALDEAAEESSPNEGDDSTGGKPSTRPCRGAQQPDRRRKGASRRREGKLLTASRSGRDAGSDANPSEPCQPHYMLT